MMYHKNRLIKAYERVGCQLKVSWCFLWSVFVYYTFSRVSKCHHLVFMFLNRCLLQANNEGVGVIGIIECFFLEPTHNQQSFDETDKYR